MFLETEIPPETCVGVVKTHSVHNKNHVQHAADVEMLGLFKEKKTVSQDRMCGRCN